MKNLKALSMEAFLHGSKQFSEDGATANDALRNLINEKLGGQNNIHSWNRHKEDVFEILEVAIQEPVAKVLRNELDGFAEYHDNAIGDKNEFRVTDPKVFRVGRIAGGANDMRRQTLTSKTFTIGTEWFGDSIYVEYEQFLAGMVDWSEMVNRISQAFVTRIQELIAEGMQQAYTAVKAPYKLTGSVTLDNLVALANRVSIKANRPVAIYGTKTALAKVAALDNVQLYSGDMKNELNQNGYLGMVRGLKLIEIPQAFKANQDEFALDDTKVLVLPANESIVAVATEGQTEVYESDQTASTAMQMEMSIRRKLGVAVLEYKVYGVAELTA